jgi:hypothetical protein
VCFIVEAVVCRGGFDPVGGGFDFHLVVHIIVCVFDCVFVLVGGLVRISWGLGEGTASLTVFGRGSRRWWGSVG